MKFLIAYYIKILLELANSHHCATAEVVSFLVTKPRRLSQDYAIMSSLFNR